jgi:putative MATE family efflux protein
MCKYIREYLADSRFRKTMLGIAAPITLQILLSNSLSLVDTLMVGRLGEAEVAAVGLANQMFFLIFLIFFGITSGTAIFVSQFWGDRDERGIHNVVGLSLAGVLIFAVPFTLASLIFPAQLMRVFTPDPAVISLGVDYLRWVAPSYILSGISFAFAMALRSIERPRIPLLSTAISMGLNTVLNLVLIFGLLGFPALGVKGAAIATLISRGVEPLVMITLIYRRRLPVAARLKEYLGFDAVLVKKFFATVGPVLLNEATWSLGMVMYKIVFSRMGTAVVAAANITESIQGLFFVVLMGTGNTAAIMIGKKIGEGKREEAGRFARLFLVQGVILGVGLGILMSAAAPVLVLLLRMQPETVVLVRLTLFALGFLVPIKSFNLHMIVGILRSGGDTKFSFLIEFLGVWGIGVPLAFFSGLVLDLPLPAVYLILGTEEAVKLIITAYRFRSGKWINDLTRKNMAEAVPVEPAPHIN